VESHLPKANSPGREPDSSLPLFSLFWDLRMTTRRPRTKHLNVAFIKEMLNKKKKSQNGVTDIMSTFVA
jgi:hypothetical protein